MILKEFFGNTLNLSNKDPEKKMSNDINADDLFWFILDDDHLHKKHFFPIARKLKQKNKPSDEIIIEMFMPMVKEGCLKFYKKNKLTGKPAKLFPKELREQMCSKIYQHFENDIKEGVYKLE